MWSSGTEVRQSTPMHKGSEKEEEVMEAHKGAGRATEWVSQPWMNFFSLTMKEEWVANIKINTYSSVPSGFFGFSGLGFFFSHEHLPSKKQSYFTISSLNTTFAPLLYNYMKETWEFNDSVKGQRADTWTKSGSKFIIMHISGLSTLQTFHLIPAVEQC